MKLQIIYDSDEHGEFVSVKFEDGTFTMARPVGDSVAERRQVMLHDPLHVLLAAARGELSDTLWRKAHGDDLDLDSVRIEEADVLLIQGTINLLVNGQNR